MFIKICGMTSATAVVAAVECGVDAVGFVFTASPRRLAPAVAAEYALQAPRGLLRVAVTRQPTQSLIDEVLRVLRPDVLQTDIGDLAGLNLPRDLAVWPVVRSYSDVPSAIPGRLLFEGAVSGSGNLADWSTASALARRAQLILAGGLDASNVAQAIGCVRPFGVDVSSGVESERGVKDARRMAEFVTAVREASRVPAALPQPGT